MAEENKSQPSKGPKFYLWVALILGFVVLLTPGVLDLFLNFVSDRIRYIQEQAELSRANSEANRTLKLNPATLETELAAINLEAIAEAIRSDIDIVKQRVESIENRYVNISRQAEKKYANQIGPDTALLETLKHYGPHQVITLDRYLDLIDKAEQGVAKTKDPSDYAMLLRRITRTVRQEYVQQYIMSRFLTNLEKQFRAGPAPSAVPKNWGKPPTSRVHSDD
jgi:hypothetical protein